MNPNPISVIPTGVQPSALGWLDGVEEPAFGVRWQAGRLITSITALGFLVLSIAGAAAEQSVSGTAPHGDL